MKCSLGISSFHEETSSLPILFFPSISLHCSFKKAFLLFFAVFWNSVFSWVYLSLSLLLFHFSSSAFCKTSSDIHFAFLHTLCLGWFRSSPTVVQWLSHVRLFATPCTVVCQASLSFTIYQSLLKLMSIESMMPSNHLILCRPLLLLPSIFPSIRVFSNESALRIRWPKY